MGASMLSLACSIADIFAQQFVLGLQQLVLMQLGGFEVISLKTSGFGSMSLEPGMAIHSCELDISEGTQLGYLVGHFWLSLIVVEDAIASHVRAVYNPAM